MSDHPRGVYWCDMAEAQQQAATALGFNATSWDEGAPVPVVSSGTDTSLSVSSEQVNFFDELFFCSFWF